MRKLAVAGLILTIVGILLVVGFWPLTSVSPSQLLAAHSNGSYAGYAVGTRITIHGQVMDASYADYFGAPLTRLDLNSGDPNNPVSVYVQGDARGAVTPGETVYMSAVLEQVFGVEYWQVSTPTDVHAAWPVDYGMYGLTVLGVVMVGVGSLSRRHAQPEG